MRRDTRARKERLEKERASLNFTPTDASAVAAAGHRLERELKARKLRAVFENRRAGERDIEHER